MNQEKNGDSALGQRLVLTAAPGQARNVARSWAPALHDGFFLHVPGAMSVRDFLEEFVGLEHAYVEDRIRAVFLGGHPVDDIDAAPVAAGDELSLSGAMPGVAGITMGRNNLIAVYREGITFECHGDCAEGQGDVFVRLYNFIAPETAHAFLALGVGLEAKAWNRCAQGCAPDFFAGVERAELDGRPLGPEELAALPAPKPGEVRWLTVS